MLFRSLPVFGRAAHFPRHPPPDRLHAEVREFASQPDVVAVGVVHDLNLAAKFAEHMLLLHEGRVLADGGKAEVLTVQNLHAAFEVMPVLLTNSATGGIHLAFD